VAIPLLECDGRCRRSNSPEPAVLKRLICPIKYLHNSICYGAGFYFRTLSKGTPRTVPPPIAVLTFLLNPSLFDLKSSAASLFRGSEAFGSRNKNCWHMLEQCQWTCQEPRTCNPTITALRFSTGFQSSRNILRQTFPSRSILGWYIFCVHFTFGGSCGKFWLIANEK
jgi:hypothetical protein